MVANVITTLKAKKIAFVVAPYEADSQMVWLVKTGRASAIMTEDSDLLVYCATMCALTVPVLFKFNESGMVKVTLFITIKAV